VTNPPQVATYSTTDARSKRLDTHDPGVTWRIDPADGPYFAFSSPPPEVMKSVRHSGPPKVRLDAMVVDTSIIVATSPSSVYRTTWPAKAWADQTEPWLSTVNQSGMPSPPNFVDEHPLVGRPTGIHIVVELVDHPLPGIHIV
jgi:hypothetical protein